MEIQRKANSHRSWSDRVAKEKPIKNILLNSKGEIELLVEDVGTPNLSGRYDYKVILNPDDIGKIMAEVYKQAFTKK